MQQPQPDQVRPSRRTNPPPASPYLQESISPPRSPSSSPAPPPLSTPSSPTRTRVSRPLPTPPLAPQQPFLPPYTSVDAASVPSATRPARPRGVNDLAVKTCWICQDGEDAEDTASSWVHACDCTLIAHSQCLLEWVTTYQQTHKAKPHCPVCNAPYLIRERSSELLNLYKALGRRWERLSMMLAIGGVGGGSWVATTAYGAWAIRTWAGQEVFDILVLKRGRWPLGYYINLPLIPLALILSRTTLIDSLLPFLPLSLVLSSASVSPLSPLARLSDLSFQYPPSPTLTLCLIPWARLLYLRLRTHIFSTVLGSRIRLGGLAGFMQDLEADRAEEGAEEDPLVVVAEIEFDDDGNRADGGVAEGEAAPIVDRPADRLRVGLSRFTSLVVGALLFPAMSSAAGAALFWLAGRSGTGAALLRKLLGVQAVLAVARGAGGGGSGWMGLGSRRAGSTIDPVWIRNTIGGGLVLVARDLVELAAGLLERRRKESRRVIGRKFGEGLELDWKEGTASAPASGGTNARGREARVHTML